MYCTLESTHLQIQLFWSTIVQCTVYYTILTLTTPIKLEYNCTMYCTTLQYYALTNPIILEYNCTMYCTTLQYYALKNPIILDYNCTMYCTTLQYYTHTNPIILEYCCSVYCTLESTHLQPQLYWSTIVQCIHMLIQCTLAVQCIDVVKCRSLRTLIHYIWQEQR